MASQIRVTAAVAKVLAAFLEDPTEHRYGLDLKPPSVDEFTAQLDLGIASQAPNNDIRRSR